MAKRRKRKRDGPSCKTPGGTPSEPPKRFTTNLAPITGFSKKLRHQSRIESSVVVGISILLVVIPMNALTRSALLLVDLAIVIDIVYHSTWTHYWKPRAKLSMTSLCVCGYLAIATILILREHQTARLKLEGYVESESFLRLLLFAAGVFTMYVLFKLRVLISWYFDLRRKERLAMAARFRYAEKGWLDYRVESANSSERLCILP